MATDSGDIATGAPGLVAEKILQQQEDNNNEEPKPLPTVNGTMVASDRELTENSLNNNTTNTNLAKDVEEEGTGENNNSSSATTPTTPNVPAGGGAPPPSIGTRIRRNSEKLKDEDGIGAGTPGSRKKYSLDVLLSLKDSAIGREKPSTIPDVCRSLLKANPGTFVSSSVSNRHMGGGGGGGAGGGAGGTDNSLLPSFMKSMGFGAPPPSGGDGSDGFGLRPPINRNLYRGRLSAKEMSTRTGGPGGPGRGGGGGGGGAEGSGPSSIDDVDGKMIKLNLNITEEVKLKGSANAWKPRWMQQAAGEEMDEDQKKTQELSRQFRSVLNKLTPENFNVLIEQVKTFEIDTEERLDNCIKILFEKAILELNFSDTYAKMCKELGTLLSVQSEGKKNFKRKLISQCQSEFEKHHQACKRTDKQAEENVKIKEESDVPLTAQEQEDMRLELEEQKYRIRRRALGTIRFIGELYKHEQLRANVMVSCMNILFGDDMLDEESLECLCKLLTTIGARIEKEEEKSLDVCFTKLQSVVERKTLMPGGEPVCNRIRFMIMDLLDLRKNRWQPRQAVATPKTREQIAKEVEAEETKNWLLNYNLPRGGGGGGRNHHHNDGGGGGGRGGGGGGGSASKNKRLVDEDGFVQPATTRNPWTMPAIDPKKINLSVAKAGEETRLGSASMFQGWGKTNVFASLNTDEQATPAPAPSFFGASGPMGGGSSSGGGGGGGGGGKGPGSHKKSGGGGGGGGNNSKKQHYHGRSSSHF
ncbi:eukaryotic translation initiation factor 4 gamma 3-like [Anopheles aquasalis]|uniref:eukaryotic translation initiation factor 4 gamma 3-like n=1 Tax=Anopheles aquasalis TaxID=42839 RepID=UPI00215AED13|nr:eukaryotic translation initiation factor 4 gamma 3-like [Anopheles aquasalis]XP_050088329.1 eukaryotic translation initiation factor 4 gamma 3-like [Anopheles aquasalis]XP_050088330.1 eukaryotic translation initiation factor 4 gamma 3-like [Anopheles aquasalis]XP_050088331.1 eukaryotic translation initiation factor 4 gamma 3-like [Anopheles aquasalis]XP_050088332.1 eukaryotic translation initiation factor 4 gamma 3-like [Anopheles aquasalis]